MDGEGRLVVEPARGGAARLGRRGAGGGLGLLQLRPDAHRLDPRHQAEAKAKAEAWGASGWERPHPRSGSGPLVQPPPPVSQALAEGAAAARSGPLGGGVDRLRKGGGLGAGGARRHKKPLGAVAPPADDVPLAQRLAACSAAAGMPLTAAQTAAMSATAAAPRHYDARRQDSAGRRRKS